MNHLLAGVSTDDRRAAIGSGAGTAFVYAIILLPVEQPGSFVTSVLAAAVLSGVTALTFLIVVGTIADRE